MVNKEDLAEIPIFSHVDEAGREKIASIIEKRKFLRGTPIFNLASSGKQLFIIHKGEVKITRLIRDRQEQTLALVKNGDFFGALSFVGGGEYSASAVCTVDSVIFVIDKADFDKLSREDPLLGINILKHLTFSICSHLRTMNDKFSDMVQYVSLTR